MSQQVRRRSYALLSDHARRPAALLVAGCAVVVVILGIIEHGAVRPGLLDSRVDSWVIGLFARHREELISVLLTPGSPLPVTIAVVIAAGICAAARRWRAALLLAISVPLASAITEAAKPLVGHRDQLYLSYPSGHVTGIAALAAGLIIVVSGPSGRWLPAVIRVVIPVLAVAAAVAPAVGVVAGKYHYFTGTLGGAGVATATALGTALVLDRLAARRAGRGGGERNLHGHAAVDPGMSSGHKITITPADAHIEVRVGGQKLADSRRAVVLAETGLAPRYYLPREDVRTDLLQPTSTESTCPFKGQAAYWSAEVGGEVHPDIVWSYESPIPEADGIAGLMCFWTERGAELTVDGAPAEGSSAVSPH